MEVGRIPAPEIDTLDSAVNSERDARGHGERERANEAEWNVVLGDRRRWQHRTGSLGGWTKS